MKKIIKNLEALNVFAKNLAASLQGGQVVALSGNLGAGKTTLTQLVAKHLGVKDNLQSPTFSILKIYPVIAQNFSKFCHIDLYRLDGKKNHLGLEEYLGDSDVVCFVEWAEKIKPQLPPNTIWLKLEAQADGARLVIIS